MSEQPFQRLAWQNRWVRYIQQPLVGADCFQESVLLNPENNIMVLNLSEFEFTRLFSAIMTGAEISYPDESHQVIVDFLKGIQCPPNLVPEECIDLPSYANNIAYSPANPYIEPTVIPEGYLVQPFLVNGENGNNFPGYEHFDVIVPFDAITFDIDFFDEIAGQLPTLQIMVNGAGSVNIRFLTIPQGGLVVVTLDNPPNLLDILSGIVTGAENIVDLNQDLVSLPPETAKEIIFPVQIESTGIHTVYAVFLPILDDSLIPIRFGGGFRGLELCGFLPEGDMGVQNLRFLNCNLEQQNADGSWAIVNGWEDWLDCVPSGGGGGGGAAVDFDIARSAFTPDQNFTNTAFDNFADGVANFNIVAKGTIALVICDNIQSNNSGANDNEFRVILNGVAGVDGNGIASVNGAAERTLQVSNYWENLTIGNTYPIRLQKRVSAGTGTLQSNSTINWTIIWASDLSQLFVEDVRIVGRELQKKIAGAWITVTDSLATILNQIEAIANNAQNTANSAVAVNTTQQTQINSIISVNNTQNNRLTNLENDVDDIVNIDIPQINITLADHEARITALEAAVNSGAWGGYKLGQITHTTTATILGYSTNASNSYASGASQGWIPNFNNQVDVSVENAMRFGSCVHLRVGCTLLAGFSGSLVVQVNDGTFQQLIMPSSSSGNNAFAWINISPQEIENMRILISGVSANENWRFSGAVYLCVVINPFTEALF